MEAGGLLAQRHILQKELLLFSHMSQSCARSFHVCLFQNSEQNAHGALSPCATV
jgi:hypothetical protein